MTGFSRPSPSPAVTLHSLRYSESSKIIQLYTQEWGLVSCLAKGALRPRSIFAGTLEPGQRGTVEILFRRRSGLHLLTQCQLAAGLPSPVPVFAGAVRFVILEAVLRNVPREEPNPPLFQLLARALDQVELPGIPPLRAWLVLDLFLVRLAACLGFSLPAPEGPLPMFPAAGALSPRERRCLQELRVKNLEEMAAAPPEAAILLRCGRLLLEYLVFHHESRHVPRSWHHLARVWGENPAA